MKFYNREKELESLREIGKISFETHSQMTVVSGRRRIGKTSLIKKAFEGDAGPMLYFFVGRKTEMLLVKEFMQEVEAKLGGYIPDGITSFGSLFKFLLERAKSTHFTLIIDEFQDFSRINPSIFSDMQNLWDSYRNSTRMNLVLSGSVVTMINKIFRDSKEPLFGRADNFLKLKPFKTSVIKEILSDFNPEYDNKDLLALYTVTGGIPKYIEILCERGKVTEESILKYIVSENSPFLEEGRSLLISEMGKEYSTYFSILQAISSGKTTQNEISTAIGGLQIGGHLEKLEDTYNIITKIRPVLSKPGVRSAVRYAITDNFLSFWFRFIERNRSMIELDNFQDLEAITMEHYPTFSGLILEKYFRQKLGEEGGYKEVGAWWEGRERDESHEIDIVALSTTGRNALVAEVKRARRNYEHKQFMAKVDILRQKALKGYEVTPRLLTMDDM